MSQLLIRYTFTSGWRQVTVKAANLDEARDRARTTLDCRMEREGVEAPVAHSLTLASTNWVPTDAN